MYIFYIVLHLTHSREIIYSPVLSTKGRLDQRSFLNLLHERAKNSGAQSAFLFRHQTMNLILIPFSQMGRCCLEDGFLNLRSLFNEATDDDK